MSKIVTVCLALGCLSVVVMAAAPDWPMFQGNVQRTGASRAPAIREPKVLWRAEVGIQGYLNCPVLAGGKVFVGSSGVLHNKPDAKDGVYALDAATGRTLWHFRTDKDACGVAYASGVVVSTGDDGRLRGLRASDGKQLWIVARRGELYSQPLILGKRVIVGDVEGNIVAVDVATGEIAWQTKTADTNIRGGLTSDGKHIYAAHLEGKVVCLSDAGKVLWQTSLMQGNDYWTLYPAPTLAGGTLLVGYARATTYADRAMQAINARTGAKLWGGVNDRERRNDQSFGNIRSSPAVWRGQAIYAEPYGCSMMAFDVGTGKTTWSIDIGAPMFPHWPSPAIASGTLYLPRHDGALYAVDLAKRQFAWRLYLGDHRMIGPSLPAGVLPEGRDCAWDPAVGKPLYASPAIAANGTIYVGSGEGYLYAIGETGARKP